MARQGDFLNQAEVLGLDASALLALQQAGVPPVATTTTAGLVEEATDVAALSSVGPGVPAAGLVDVGTAFTQGTLNANFATLGTAVNAILSALKAAGHMA